MNLIVTVSTLKQVSQTQYRDVNVSRVFKETDSIYSMLSWARTVNLEASFHDLLISVLDEKEGRA